MTAMTAASWEDRAAALLDSARTAGEVSSKLKQLRQLKVVLLHRDPSILPEFVTRFAELQSEPASPIRKFLAEMIGDIGSLHMEVLPKMVPCLISFLEDETPAVARQAITTGTSLYHLVLEKLVIQGLYSSEIDDSVKSSWSWMLQLKSVVFETATQSRNDGIRLRAVKFVEMLILLYTPDPYISSDPPQEPGYGLGFNISWLRGGHPVLNVGELAMEASQSLGLLLDQLRFPQVKSLSNSIVIVLIKSLSAIAMKRPSFYGRILPVLLSLDPAISVVKGVQIPDAHHALKDAFLACLKCTHSSAEPWCARLVEALKAIDAGESFDQGTDKKFGDVSVGTEGSLAIKDDNPSIQACDEATNDLQRRRSIAEVSNGLPPGDIMPAKRIRQSTDTVQDLSEESHKVTADQVQDSLPAVGSLPSRDKSSGPAQQLVAMFGALVAQGEKAAGSLEILISSISSDLLAEVVMANMQHLPPTCPNAEKEDDLASTMGNSSCVLPAVQLSSLVSDILSLSSSSPLLASLLNVHSSASHDIDPEKISQSNENNVTDAVNTTLSSRLADDSATKSSSLPVSPLPHATENGSSAVPLHVNLGQDESKIPSVDSTNSFDEIRESHDASHSSIPEPNEISQGHVTSLGEGVLSSIMSTGTITTDATEAQSTGVVHLVSHQATSTASHVTFPNVLPKMVVLDANLSDEDKDQLQKEAFIRVLDAYKQVAISGGLDTRFSLLAQLGIEFPLELDAWGLLQKHVLSDYIDHEGHELTLRILDRLYTESEQDLDFLSSRTAISISETFLLAVAESIRDTFPASDKSLSRLIAEVPYLSEGVLKLLEGLCSPDRSEKHEKDVQNGDRVIQGLSAVWNLILLRSSSRERCLLIALQSAVHPAEDVRMKAIRLVANKLFPMSSISQKIEDFAREKLHSVIDDLPSMVHLETDESTSGLQEDADLGKPFIGGLSNNGLASSTQLDQNVMSSLISEAQRCMSLYFAICTKKHSLLREVFIIYKSISKAAKEAVHRHIPILVRTIGSSPELLAVVSDPPVGSENLLTQVLHTLTDGTTPSQDLIFSVKKLYHSRMKDVEILIPVLSFLPKDEILPIFPHLVNLPLDKFQAALSRLLQGSSKTGPCLTPAEVLIAIHGIDPEKDGVPLKKVMDACSTCFEQRNVFTQQVLAKVLNQLVEQIPLPLLFMRTVLQAIGTFPSLVDFVMEILSRLVSKQIWKYPKLWVGFLKCAIQMKPQSFPVLLQLPAAQLENALNKNPLLKTPLADHANQPNIRATLPRSTLVVLGLVQDSQASSQAQTSHSQAADTGSSTAEMTAEVTQESSAVS